MAGLKINFLTLKELENIPGIGKNSIPKIASLRKEMKNQITEKVLKFLKIRLRRKQFWDFTPNPDPEFFADEDTVSEEEEDDDEQPAKQKMVQIPRSVSFNGKGNWSCFKTKFCTFISHHECNEDTKLVYLSMALEDQASIFYEKRNDQKNFTKLSLALTELENRFENPDRENAAMLQLKNTYQFEEENGRDFEDRLFELAYRAYPGRRVEHIEREVLCQFLIGLYDSKAQSYLTLNEPRDLTAAHDMIAKLAYSKQVCDRSRKGASHHQIRKMKKVDTSDSNTDSTSESENDEQDVRRTRQVQNPKATSRHFVSSKDDNPIKRMENKMNEMCESMNEMTKQLKTLCSQQRSSSANRSFSSQNRPSFQNRSLSKERKDQTCEYCKTKGHSMGYCYKLKSFIEERDATITTENTPKVKESVNPT